MKASEEDEYRRYAAARTPVLLRTAYLLCGDWHRAEDIVSAALVKLYVAWDRAARAANLDAYVRQIVVRAWLDERRRPWRREHAVGPALPEEPAPADLAADSAARVDLRRALAAMPPRQRAVLVLRFYEDMSVEQTAAVLRCSAGAVRTMTHRALAALRAQLPGIEVADDQLREAR
jgi:RNA polymerase sigma-70 factor (sigma-E family)